MMRKIDINYSIDEFGNVFKNGKQIKKTLRKDKGTYTVYINGKRYALATLVAKYFLQKEGRNLIFKDRDRTNCHYSNIMFIDNKNYRTYCRLHRYTRSKVIDFNESKNIAKCDFLRKYYETKNEKYLFESWNNVENKLSPKFNDLKDELFEYFDKRAKQGSLLGCPTGLLIMYSKGLMKNKIQFNDRFLKHTGGQAGN